MRKLASRAGEGKRKPDPNVVGKLRVHELNRLFAYRFRGSREGWQFPDDDAGLECLKILIQHYRRSFPEKMSRIIQVRAPWADADDILEEVVENPKAWRAAALGREVNFTRSEWREFRFRTIAPVDMTLQERRRDSRALSNARQLQRRRQHGTKTREEYLAANSLSRDKPWEAENMSRAEWYRRRTKAETSLATIKLTTVTDRPVSTGLEGVQRRARSALGATLAGLEERKQGTKGLVSRPPLKPASPDWSPHPMSALRYWSPGPVELSEAA